jgi:hypothetical protein
MIPVTLVREMYLYTSLYLTEGSQIEWLYTSLYLIEGLQIALPCISGFIAVQDVAPKSRPAEGFGL